MSKLTRSGGHVSVYQGSVVNGYSRHAGLEFSREARSQAEHDEAVAAAWRTSHVVRVVTEWPHAPSTEAP